MCSVFNMLELSWLCWPLSANIDNVVIWYFDKSVHADVWKNFKLVLLDKNEVEYAVCINCQTVVTYKRRDGTKGFHSHMWHKRKRML